MLLGRFQPIRNLCANNSPTENSSSRRGGGLRHCEGKVEKEASKNQKEDGYDDSAYFANQSLSSASQGRLLFAVRLFMSVPSHFRLFKLLRVFIAWFLPSVLGQSFFCKTFIVFISWLLSSMPKVLLLMVLLARLAAVTPLALVVVVENQLAHQAARFASCFSGNPQTHARRIYIHRQ